tara:strand:- start:36 stop:560 length:525 start_codon:yes stop_codon:yes gene_type:complete
MDMIKKVVDTQTAYTTANTPDTTTYKAGMNTGDFNKLAEKMFPGEVNPETNAWVMDGDNLKDYTALMTQFTDATAVLNGSPNTKITIGGKTFEIDIARDLMDGQYPTGSVTFQSLLTSQNPEAANVYKSQLLYYIRDLQKSGGGPTIKEEVQMSLDPNFIALDNAEKEDLSIFE